MVLTRFQAHCQVGVLSFSGAAMTQILTLLEMLEVRDINGHLDKWGPTTSLETNPGRL